MKELSIGEKQAISKLKKLEVIRTIAQALRLAKMIYLLVTLFAPLQN